MMEPTRQRGTNAPNCLDLVISTNEHNVINIDVTCSLGKADHKNPLISFDGREINNFCI